MEIDRKRIENIINKLQDINDVSFNDEFNVAMYIYLKYGKFEFDNYICDDELEEITEKVKEYGLKFDENLDKEVAKILKEDEE